jgi:hypothetical protein
VRCRLTMDVFVAICCSGLQSSWLASLPLLGQVASSTLNQTAPLSQTAAERVPQTSYGMVVARPHPRMPFCSCLQLCCSRRWCQPASRQHGALRRTEARSSQQLGLILQQSEAAAAQCLSNRMLAAQPR